VAQNILIGMGNSFASKRIRKRLQRMLVGCEERHIFKGPIVEFEIVDQVPKDRPVKGMLVDTPGGKRYVNFCPSVESTSVVPVSSLDVGDIVVVLGEKHEHMENATFPRLIALPEEHTVLVSEEPPRFPGDSSERTTAVWDFIILSVLVFLCCMSFFLFPVLLPFFGLSVFLYVAIAAPFFGIAWYHKHTRRARVLRFDPERWADVVAFIKDRITVYKSNILNPEL
jgi:hypothetical protein